MSKTPWSPGTIILEVPGHKKMSSQRSTFPKRLHLFKWRLMPRLRKTLAASIVFEEYANDLAVWKNVLWWLREINKRKTATIV